MRNDEILKRTEEGVKESNKILIQELIQDLENKGISPVISIDGKVKKLRLKLIDESELEDFLQISFEKFGCIKDDFCILECDQTEKNTTISCIVGTVVAVNKKTGRVREYKAGTGSHWVADFHRDLESGFFTN